MRLPAFPRGGDGASPPGACADGDMPTTSVHGAELCPCCPPSTAQCRAQARPCTGSRPGADTLPGTVPAPTHPVPPRPGRRVSLSPLPLRRRVWAHGPAAAPAPCYAKVRPAHRQSRLLRKNDSQETPEGVQCLPAQSGASAPCSPPMPRGLTSWARRGPLSTLFPVASGKGSPTHGPHRLRVEVRTYGLELWGGGSLGPHGGQFSSRQLAGARCVFAPNAPPTGELPFFPARGPPTGRPPLTQHRQLVALVTHSGDSLCVWPGGHIFKHLVLKTESSLLPSCSIFCGSSRVCFVPCGCHWPHVAP